MLLCTDAHVRFGADAKRPRNEIKMNFAKRRFTSMEKIKTGIPRPAAFLRAYKAQNLVCVRSKVLNVPDLERVSAPWYKRT
jgi:hypothetical protein